MAGTEHEDIKTLGLGKPGDANDLIIRGRAVRVTYEEVAHDKLRFYEANPRVYSLLRRDGKVPTQADIEKRLLEMEHVKELIQDIRRNGGLIEPILVKRGSYEVLEGNSRLAAYRALDTKEPTRWTKIRCIMLPETLPDDLTFALLAQLHVKGKKDWAPFEQAGFLYRRYHEQNVDVPTLSGETGLSQQRVRQLIETHAFMTSSHETEITRWSHYEEFLKSRVIQRVREKYPTFDNTVIALIQGDRNFKAVDVRDRLPKICIGPTRTLKRFAEGLMQFESAYESALNGGADNTALRRINRFRQWLAEAETARDLVNATDQDRDKITYELEKIRNRLVSLQALLARDATRKRR